MKIAIVGLPQAGQQQLFSLLTDIPLESFQHKTMEAQQGICLVKDPRLAKLADLYNPKKVTYARIEYLLLPDFNLQGPAKAVVFSQLKNADELCFVCREEKAVAAFIAELIISDLMFVEKRLDNLAKAQKKKFAEQAEKEKILIEKCKVQLEQEQPLRLLNFTLEERSRLQNDQLLTMKPIILALNVGEEQLKDGELSAQISAQFSYPVIQVCAELEQEINQLDEVDQPAFMKEMGIEESALTKMNQQAFASLGLISFFTVGDDEVRAWPLKQGSAAPQAGSTIHSDMERGFVRAEMFTYEDLMQAGSEARLKELGKVHLKGRDYIVQDGDILNFRFNV